MPQPSTRKRTIGGARLETDEATSRRMAKIRQADTNPERIFRTLLVARGLRYRLKNRDLPGSPDVANRRHKWAVFVHGCFWHHHKGCRLATVPRRNRSFWLTKFAANRKRDAEAIRWLRTMGFSVLLVWQCELEKDQARIERRLDCFFTHALGKRPS